MKRILLLFPILLLTACTPSTPTGPTESLVLAVTPLSTAASTLTPFAPFSDTPPTVTLIPPTETPLPPTATFTPVPANPTNTSISTETPTTAYTDCGWQWARQNLPDVSARFLDQPHAAGLPIETARAEAYGENCLGADGSIVRFAAMETDFYVTLTVSDLGDETILGGLLEQTFTVLDQFPADQTPGPQPGYIGITFKAGEQVQNLWFQQTRIAELRSQGLSGADLYHALKN